MVVLGEVGNAAPAVVLEQGARMALTETFIRDCADDDALFRALADELSRRVPRELEWDTEGHLARMRALPPGLRAMIAIYQLDVSMTLDDLGWHFGNWPDRALRAETLQGLKELEAHEAAEIFAAACALAEPYWDTIVELRKGSFDEFADWYRNSDLDKALQPLNDRMWAFCGRTKSGLLTYWVAYARKYPERVVG
jgi:hypothetical protein